MCSLRKIFFSNRIEQSVCKLAIKVQRYYWRYLCNTIRTLILDIAPKRVCGTGVAAHGIHRIIGGERGYSFSPRAAWPMVSLLSTQCIISRYLLLLFYNSAYRKSLNTRTIMHSQNCIFV